jgi:two-component system CheB/CheR fusion protein
MTPNLPLVNALLHTDPSKVVVVGASAGGLSALERFLRMVPPDSGMAFFVIQHLVPDHKSLMEDLLAPKVQLPVCVVEDGQELEANKIYLSPPGKVPVAEGGQVTLKDWPKEKKLVLPINIFLHSLSEFFRNRAIAVILSGTGSDGTEGAKAISSSGGQVFVQEPQDCEFSGMPQSVISAEVPCSVADADKLWGMIDVAQQSQSPQIASDEPVVDVCELPNPGDAPAPSSAFTNLFQYLHQQFELDFSGYQLNSIGRRVERRMQLLSVRGEAEYLKYIQEHEDESKALYKDLLIGVTQFFRDQPAFDVLSVQALEPALQMCKKPNFRIWVAGCATGEEAYSLCILAMEAAAKVGYRGRVSVFATDVFEPAINFAREGIYDAKKLETIEGALRDRYFSPTHDSLYKVIPELRERVIFSRHNFLVDPPFASLDLVSCRNVLIYMTPETQELALKSFSYALGAEGILFLGSSESIGAFSSAYAVVASRAKVFKKQNTAMDAQRWLKPLKFDGMAKSTLERKERLRASVSIPKDLLDAYDSLLGRFAPDGFLVNRDHEILHYLGAASEFCILAQGRVSPDLLSQVGEDLRLAITSLFYQVTHQEKRCTVKHVRCEKSDGPSIVDVSIEPLQGARGAAYVYLIELSDARSAPLSSPAEDTDSDATGVSDGSPHQRLRILEEELRSAKDNYKAANESLQIANAQLNAFNEEMNAANEELQNSNEELNSMNEELITLNAEYERKNEQLIELNIGHDNLLNSTEDGVLFVDMEMSIQRFNDSIANAFSLRHSDVGRSLSDIAFKLGEREEMLQDVRDVLSGKDRVERETVFFEDRLYLRRVSPFKSDKNQVVGALLIFTDVTKLRNLERRFEFAVQAAQMSWWDWDLTTGRLEVHSAGDCLLGLGCLDTQRDRDGWMEAVHPDDQKLVKESLDAHLRDETEEWVCEHRFRTGSGEWLWVSNRGVVTQRDTRGAPLEMIGTTQDVDSYHKALIESTGQRNVLQVAGEIARLGAWEYEISSGELTWSAEIYRILGRDLGNEVKPEDSFKYFPAKSGEALEAAFKKLITDGISYDLKLECINAQGSHLMTRMSGHPQRDANGQLIRVIGVFQDITEITKTERGIRAFFDLSPDFQATVNFEGIFQSFSPTWLRQFNLTSETLGVTSVVDMIHPEDRVGFEELLESVIAGEEVTSYEARIKLCQEGQCDWGEGDTWLSWSLSSDSLLGLVFISARNITEQKTATKKLNDALIRAEEANRVKSDFLSVMSHELRTPLNPIMGFAELMADETENETHRELLDTIVQSGSLMIGMINEILDYSKIEAGKVEVVLVEFSLVDLVQVEMNLMRGSLKREGVTLDYEIDKGPLKKMDLPVFKGDASMLKHILRNLLSNALKFTTAGHVILRVRILSVEEIKAIVCFEVEDTGLGIDPSQHSQVFEAFVQADSSHTRQYGGTGLGLAICKRLSDLMEGRISLHSEVGKGSTFKLTVPLEIMPEVKKEADLSNASSGRVGNPVAAIKNASSFSILVVEDDAANAFFMTSLLKRLGFGSRHVQSGEDALEILAQQKASFTAIFLDLHMPGIGGVNTLKEVRRFEALGEESPIPIYIITADVHDSTRKECMEAGASGFIFKPVDIAELRKILTDLSR